MRLALLRLKSCFRRVGQLAQYGSIDVLISLSGTLLVREPRYANAAKPIKRFTDGLT